MGKAGCRKIAKHLPSNQSYCGIPPHYLFQIFGFDQTHGLCKLSLEKKRQSALGLFIRDFSIVRLG